MALKKTNKIGYQQSAVPFCAGDVKTAKFVADISAAGLAAADVLEFGVIPAGCDLISATLVSTGIDAVATLDVGVLSGSYGADGDDRVIPAAAELFNDVAKNAIHTANAAQLAAIGRSDKDRGIGLKLSASEAAGAATTVTLYVNYTQY